MDWDSSASDRVACPPEWLRAARGMAVAAVLGGVIASCGGVSYAYRTASATPAELHPMVAVRNETFVVQIKNGSPEPIFVDWSTARFVDVAGLERPLVLMSEDNVGSPDIPLDPGATVIYQLAPAHYYIPSDRMWARRTSLRELITYPDQFQASESRQVTLRVAYCVGRPCTAAEECCSAPAGRQTIEASLAVAPEVTP